MLKDLIEHPYTRGLHLDDPETTVRRRKIIKEKAFLQKLYQEWYSWLIEQLPPSPGKVLELGSGGGFFKEMMPESITSDISFCPNAEIVCDGRMLPFDDGCLRGIVMVNVFHHIPDAAKFLSEAARTVRTGGVIAMIEPWFTPWAYFIYKHFHSEAFEPKALEWRFPFSGPLSSANGALPWIVFCRDRKLFRKHFPTIRIKDISLDYPISYLASGGVSLRSLFPGWSFEFLRKQEGRLAPIMEKIAMFGRIALVRSAE